MPSPADIACCRPGLLLEGTLPARRARASIRPGIAGVACAIRYVDAPAGGFGFSSLFMHCDRILDERVGFEVHSHSYTFYRLTAVWRQNGSCMRGKMVQSNIAMSKCQMDNPHTTLKP